jgi:hypothetical protein
MGDLASGCFCTKLFTYAITLFFAGYFAMGVNISGNMSIRKFADPDITVGSGESISRYG